MQNRKLLIATCLSLLCGGTVAETDVRLRDDGIGLRGSAAENKARELTNYSCQKIEVCVTYHFENRKSHKYLSVDARIRKHRSKSFGGRHQRQLETGACRIRQLLPYCQRE